MQGILGKKLGMTRMFLEEGKAVAVTVIEAGPCVVIQKKGESTQGTVYQLGFVPAKPKSVNKPLGGHFKKKGLAPLKYLKEFPASGDQSYQVGDEIRVDIFQVGEKVKVRGTSKGKGFAGVVKRWGFSGGKGHPWLHLPPGSGFHRLQRLPFPGHQREKNARPDGKPPGQYAGPFGCGYSTGTKFADCQRGGAREPQPLSGHL